MLISTLYPCAAKKSKLLNIFLSKKLNIFIQTLWSCVVEGKYLKTLEVHMNLLEYWCDVFSFFKTRDFSLDKFIW